MSSTNDISVASAESAEAKRVRKLQRKRERERTRRASETAEKREERLSRRIRDRVRREAQSVEQRQTLLILFCTHSGSPQTMFCMSLVISLSVTETTQLAIPFTPESERRLKKSSYSAKFKNQLVQLHNFSSAHHIVLSIEDRVDVHCWLKSPHKRTQTTLIC